MKPLVCKHIGYDQVRRLTDAYNEEIYRVFRGVWLGVLDPYDFFEIKFAFMSGNIRICVGNEGEA